MRRREPIAESITPDGERLSLTVEQGEHVVRVRGEVLMSSRACGSEQAMATYALPEAVTSGDMRILVGGLGMGYTLRAVLDRAGSRARVTVVELLDEVVSWNRGPLAVFAGHPLDDPRVSVTIADLLDYLPGGDPAFDAILLDIDNGPEAFTVLGNDRLYQAHGLALLYRALRGGGVVVFWSAFRSRAFERRLQRAGFDARSVTTRARAAVGKGARHTLFVATRPWTR